VDSATNLRDSTHVNIFRSATLQLTAWYLAILMSITIVFSLVIYQLNYHEVSMRLENLQQVLMEGTFSLQLPKYIAGSIDNPASPLMIQSSQAAQQMAMSLVYINVFILIAGGLGSYFLARRTLKPIEQAHEAQSRFTSDASHELRTPLAAMKMELEVALRDNSITVEESKEVISSSLEEVDKLTKLTEMLLSLARLDYDKLQREPIDVVALLDDAMKPYARQKKRFDITTRKSAVVYANKAAITELIGILVDNALKYSPEKSPISIRIFQKRGLVGFEVTNTGTPISAESIHRIFDRFYRTDTSRTNGTKRGYGLGLSIAKKITDIHNGEITASSSPLQTVFTWYLPIYRKSQAKNDGKITTT